MYIFRFLAVVFPVSSISLRTVPITRLAILVTWSIILASNVPVWMAHFTHEIDNGMTRTRRHIVGSVLLTKYDLSATGELKESLELIEREERKLRES